MVSRGESSESSPTRAHLGYVDGLRALAALYVLIGHMWLECFPIVYGPSRLPRGRFAALTGWMLYSHFAVSVFIVISGFCLALPVMRSGGRLRGGALAFYKRRIRRIVPPFYAAVAFSLLCIWLLIGQKTGTHWDFGLPVTPRDVLMHVVLLQDIFAQFKINSVFWSIAVEFRIYILFPLFVVLLREGRALPLLALGVLAPLIYYLRVGGTLFPQSGDLAALNQGFTGIAPSYICLFALGMLAARLACAPRREGASPPRAFPWTAAAIALFASIIALSYLFGGYFGFTNYRWAVLDLLVGLCAFCVLVRCALPRQTALRRVLGWRPLAFVGTFAYSIYLIHFPLEQIIWQYLIHPLGLNAYGTFVVMLPVATPLILGASYLFFLIAERPFLHARASRRATSDRVIGASEGL